MLVFMYVTCASGVASKGPGGLQGVDRPVLTELMGLFPTLLWVRGDRSVTALSQFGA